jgi:protein involved in polysaccharide export with SLBB domain
MGSVVTPLAQSASPRARRALKPATLAARAGTAVSAAFLLGGCSMDSFIDPSITGRWEDTPTSMPILDRLSVIEDDTGDSVEYSDVTPDDLIPESREYRIAPGDRLLVTLYDFEDRQSGTEFTRDVDLQGNVDLPQLGLVNIAGKTVGEAQDEVGRALSRFVRDPLVAIVPVAQRQQTFSVVGSVETPGPYFIPRPDYRLLEAVTASGRFPETIEEIYVIRQLALDESMTTGVKAPSQGTQTTSPTGTSTTPSNTKTPENSESLINLIDELSGSEKPAEAPAQGTQPQQPEHQPEQTPPPAEELPEAAPQGSPEPKSSAPSVLRPSIDLIGASQPETQTTSQPPQGQEPAIDLVGGDAPQTQQATPAATSSEPTWVFVNGEWVMVKSQRGQAATAGKSAAASTTNDTSAMVTQRVIRIPVKALLSGDARYNIVVRKGDTIRVPSPTAGLVYLTGQVQRPGPYSLPDVGKLTLLRAIDSAGGLSAIAIPERCDITRIVGKDRQATVRVDLRAVSEQTEPDIYLKPDDRINVGTNFWALPLAVIRGGFRTNYGFGFVVDRNFGNDVFGPPPENRGF